VEEVRADNRPVNGALAGNGSRGQARRQKRTAWL